MKKDIYIMALCQGLMMSANSMIIAIGALVGLALMPDNPILITLPIGIQYFSTMIFTFYASNFSTKNSRKVGFKLSAIIAIIGSGICFFAISSNDFWLYCFGSAFIGFFNAFAQQYKFAAAEIIKKEKRAKAISYVLTGGLIAAFIGPMLANYSSALSDVKFSGIYLITIGIYFLSYILFYLYQGKEEVVNKEEFTKSVYSLFFNKVFISAVIFGMTGYGIMNLLMISSPMAMGMCGYSFSDSTMVLQWHFLFMFAPSFFTGTLIKKYGENNIMIIGIFILYVCILMGKNDESLMGYWITLSLLGIGWNFVYIVSSTMIAKNFEDYGNKAKGLFDTMVFIAVSITAFSSGWLQNTLGWNGVLSLIEPLIYLMAIVLIWLKFESTT